MTEHREHEIEGPPGPAELLTWAPLGLWGGLALALARIGAQLSIAHQRVGITTAAEAELLQWNVFAESPGTLVEALAIGVLASYLAHRAVRTAADSFLLFVFLFTGVAATAFLTGRPAAPLAQRGRLVFELGLDSLPVQVGLGFVFAALMLGLARFMRGAQRVLLRGGLALVLAIAGLATAFGFSIHALELGAPTFVQRNVQYDFLAANDWTIETFPQGHSPTATVLTPEVEARTDSADKPAIWMPPPASVRLVVPEGDAGKLVLRAAAGVDRSVFYGMPAELERVRIDFRVRQNGVLVFDERIVVDQRNPAAGWTPEKRVWQHVGGVEGLSVEPGDVLVLETALPAGGPEQELPLEYLRAGFGALYLEAQEAAVRTRARPEAPNLVLIVMDTQRADRLSCYGYERPTTPNLDRLARIGTRFENAYSTSSWTWPATASILTGLQPLAHGVTSNESCTLDQALTTLPEALQGRGYATAAFSCNELISQERYFDQGFEHFVHAGRFPPSGDVMPGVLRWLEVHQGARFFLYLHLADPHTPHKPDAEQLARLDIGSPPEGFPPEQAFDVYTGRINRSELAPGDVYPDADAVVPPDHQRAIHDIYDASVATGDFWVGELMKKLAELGLDGKTIVAFTSDHGEELFDHGMLEHGHTLHTELVRVPLIVAGPGLARGVIQERVVSNRHLAPTLAQLGGTELEGLEDAEDLLAEEGSNRAAFETVKGYWRGSKKQHLAGLRRGADVLHWRVPGAEDGEEDGAQGRRDDLQLFNTTTDPRELVDQAAQREETADELLHDLRGGLRRALELRGERQSFGAGAAMRAGLSAIGYLGGEDDED